MRIVLSKMITLVYLILTLIELAYSYKLLANLGRIRDNFDLAIVKFDFSNGYPVN